MTARNEYLATWADGTTMRFVSTDRKSAGEAIRSLNVGRVASIRKLREVEVDDDFWPAAGDTPTTTQETSS